MAVNAIVAVEVQAVFDQSQTSSAGGVLEDHRHRAGECQFVCGSKRRGVSDPPAIVDGEVAVLIEIVGATLRPEAAEVGLAYSEREAFELHVPAFTRVAPAALSGLFGPGGKHCGARVRELAGQIDDSGFDLHLQSPLSGGGCVQDGAEVLTPRESQWTESGHLCQLLCMPARQRSMPPLRVAILSLPESGTMAAFGLHEVLGSAGGEVSSNARAIRPTLVARRTRPFVASSGLRVTPQEDLAARGADVLIVCDIHLSSGESPAGRWKQEIDWVRRHLDRGALVCATCSGAVLLAEAGLLDGADAASHWTLADLFRDRYPQVRFRPERILCDSGYGGQLVTTGGASAWQDLALWLIARFCGAQEAARIARLFLLGDRGHGQLPFASMARPRQHNDAVIARVQTWLVKRFTESNPVAAMVARSGLRERSFKRRFSAATGYSPVEYVQALRIEAAKQLLDSGDAGIEDVAAAVGYEDPTFFRRLFKRRVGVSPAQYRRQNRSHASLA